jgi:hypothetical protein
MPKADGQESKREKPYFDISAATDGTLTRQIRGRGKKKPEEPQGQEPGFLISQMEKWFQWAQCRTNAKSVQEHRSLVQASALATYGNLKGLMTGSGG